MPSLNERKLISIGGSLLISVPKAWRDYYGLKAGDVVVVIANGELRISPLGQNIDSGKLISRFSKQEKKETEDKVRKKRSGFIYEGS